jgi:tetratricopeptide (TPR) repeat protein
MSSIRHTGLTLCKACVRTLVRWQSIAGCILLAAGLLLAGCATRTTNLSPENSDASQIPASWKPHLLYMLPAPEPRLHVEVDAVAGCEPRETDLNELRQFLSTYCNKPGGIEIVRSDVIPAEAAKGFSATALARRYINGPDTNNASPAAFMYVLFYNGPKSAKPYTEVLPYPAIYFNARYLSGSARDEALLHETAHMLGLVQRTSGMFLHCPKETCLMNADLRMRLQLLGRQIELCADCVAELAASSTQPPPANLRFVGPVLVRSESNYQVLILPDRILLLVGGSLERGVRQFVDRVHSEKPDNTGRRYVECIARSEVLDDPAKLAAVMTDFKNDPFEIVRQYGPKTWLRACVGGYIGRAQYAKSVAMLREAIVSDSKDDWSYNQLAWIEATVPDASVRNGTEAVTAAIKACELTEWRNWRGIDTLAAAYAEAGDFKRAIEFQEQALRTGNPTEVDRKAMRERLSLYQQSKPFRLKIGSEDAETH